MENVSDSNRTSSRYNLQNINDKESDTNINIDQDIDIYANTEKNNEINFETKNQTNSSPNQIVTLERIQIYNFLSFEHGNIELSPEFTIITGPNGAGKSTIFQAFKFALGTNDYDGRYSRWNDFIRNGEDWASVIVHLKINKEIYFIKRTIFRNRGLKSEIRKPDDKKFHRITIKELKQFLDKIGLDPENIFAFMSQGNIVTIKNFKEDKLCKFVEKGIGLENLTTKIIAQKEKINYLNEKYKGLDSEQSSISSSIQDLAPKLERLVEKQKLMKKYQELRRELMLSKKSNFEKQLENNKNELNKVNHELKNIQNNKEELENQINEYNYKIKDIELDLHEIEFHLKIKKDEIYKIEQKLKMFKEEKQEIAETLEDLKQEIETLKDKKRELKQQERIFKKKTTELKNHKEQVIQTRNSLIDEKKEIMDKFRRHQQSIHEYQKTKQEINLLERKIEQFNQELDEKENQLDGKIKQINHINKDLEKEKWFLKDPTIDLKKKMEKLKNNFSQRIVEINNQLDALQKDHNEIEKTIESIQQNYFDKAIPKPRAIQQVMNEINNRNIACIGPLLDYISFDSLYQEAIQSVLGNRVLYSFIAENREAFEQLTYLVKVNHAYCNVYLTRNKTFKKLEDPPESTKNGLFGYISTKITPIVKDPNKSKTIMEVILDAGGKTIIAKDNVVALDAIQRYNLDNWMVTLDGEQIRPKKHVIESKPFIRRKSGEKWMNTAQARQRLDELNKKEEKNRDKYNNLQKELDGIKRKYDLLNKRLIGIENLLDLFKSLQFLSRSKDNIIKEKKILFNQIQDNKNKIKDLENRLIELEAKLPKGTDTLQKRLDEIPYIIQKLDEQLREYDESLDNYNAELTKIQLNLGMLEKEFEYKKNKIEDLERELKEQDQEFANLINNKMNLEQEIISKNNKSKKLSEEKQELQKEIEKIKKVLNERDSIFRQLEERKHQINFNITKLTEQLEQISQHLEIILMNINKAKERQVKTEEIIKKKNELEKEKSDKQNIKRTVKIEEKDEIYTKLKIRETIVIQKEISELETILIHYSDIDETLIDQKKDLEESLKAIQMKKQSLQKDLESIKIAEEKLEREYYKKFQEKLIVLEKIINEKLNSAQLGFKIALKLKGEINELKLQIHTSIPTDPDQKTIYKLKALSGGQSSMVGVALMLSLTQLNSSPINIYDEVEMHLDPQNAQKVAKLIYEMAHQGNQFILIMPDKSKTLLRLAKLVLGVSRNGPNGTSTVHSCVFHQPH